MPEHTTSLQLCFEVLLCLCSCCNVVTYFIDVVVYDLMRVTTMGTMISTTNGVAESGNFTVVDVRKDASVTDNRN